MRTAYRRCRYCGELHDLADWPDNHRDPAPARSELEAPQLIRDQMDALWHPGNGQHYESKSEFRAITKARGSEEVGNDRQTDNRKVDRVTRDDIGQAMQKVAQGYRPTVQSETLT